MNKAYTLIELLVSLSIFSLVIGSISSLFVYSLRAQRNLLQTRTVLDELSYAMEYMSKAIRMAQKDLGGNDGCVTSTTALLNYKKTHDGQGIKFKNSQGICQEFYLDSETNRLVEIKDKEENYLTSGNFKITSFEIAGEGWGQDDDKQPLVTLFLLTPKIKIQTTISQRNLDVRKE